MGTFQDYGSYGGYEVVEGGAYVCNFVGVTAEQGEVWGKPGVMENKFKFVFESVDVIDANGYPHQFVQFTKTSYGDTRANLTTLLNGMVGRPLTREEFARLTDQQLQKRQYLLTISQKLNDKGVAKNQIDAVCPYRQPGAAQAQPQQTRPQAPQPYQQPAPQQYQQPAPAPQQRPAAPQQPQQPQQPFRNTAPEPTYAAAPQGPAAYDDSEFANLEDPFAE